MFDKLNITDQDQVQYTDDIDDDQSLNPKYTNALKYEKRVSSKLKEIRKESYTYDNVSVYNKLKELYSPGLNKKVVICEQAYKESRYYLKLVKNSYRKHIVRSVLKEYKNEFNAFRKIEEKDCLDKILSKHNKDYTRLSIYLI